MLSNSCLLPKYEKDFALFRKFLREKEKETKRLLAVRKREKKELDKKRCQLCKQVQKDLKHSKRRCYICNRYGCYDCVIMMGYSSPLYSKVLCRNCRKMIKDSKEYAIMKDRLKKVCIKEQEMYKRQCKEKEMLEKEKAIIIKEFKKQFSKIVRKKLQQQKSKNTKRE